LAIANQSAEQTKALILLRRQEGCSLGATAFSITTLSIMTLGILGFFATLSINDIHKMTLNIMSLYIECRVYLNVMLSVVAPFIRYLNFLVPKE
jgi:hypothetical protein